MIRSKEEHNKYSNQHNLHNFDSKIQIYEHQYLTKKEEIKVRLVKIIQPMEDNHLMKLSLLILIIIRNQVTVKRRAARKKVKEIARYSDLL